MPTLFTHAFVGLTASTVIPKRREPKRFFALSILCTVLPDADVLGFKFGIPYSHFLGHRGFFHSLSFACLLGFCLVLIFFGRKKLFSGLGILYVVYFSLLTASHGILDAFTNGGLGIALLSPFNNERYFFWITPIAVSPINPRSFFTDRGLGIMKNEILWIWLPSFCLIIFTRLYVFVTNKWK